MKKQLFPVVLALVLAFCPVCSSYATIVQGGVAQTVDSFLFAC